MLICESAAPLNQHEDVIISACLMRALKQHLPVDVHSTLMMGNDSADNGDLSLIP